MTFRIGDISFAMPLPDNAKAIASAGGDRAAFDLTKGGRLERRLDLASAASGSDARYDRERKLVNGGRLEFRVDNIGGGSGGPVAELSGRLHIAAHILSITCTDQDESAREPDWCLPYLDRLEILQRGR